MLNPEFQNNRCKMYLREWPRARFKCAVHVEGAALAQESQLLIGGEHDKSSIHLNR
jgi:hypothetical protein